LDGFVLVDVRQRNIAGRSQQTIDARALIGAARLGVEIA
jgi:hypothetical protein